MESGGEVRVFDTVEDLSTGLVDHIVQLSEAYVRERGAFSLVLSGGSHLLHLLRKLGGAPYLKTVDWSKWHVFWAEENVVPRNHPSSHYRLAKEAFLSKVPLIPSKVVAAVSPSLPLPLSAESVGEDYEYRIRQLVKSRTVDVALSSDCPRFDLVLLALGREDKVISSFCSHNPMVLDEHADDQQCPPWVAPVKPLLSSPSPPPTEKVAMTMPVIKSAANLAVIAVGPAVAEALKLALMGSNEGNVKGKLVWFVDEDAASVLGIN